MDAPAHERAWICLCPSALVRNSVLLRGVKESIRSCVRASTSVHALPYRCGGLHPILLAGCVCLSLLHRSLAQFRIHPQPFEGVYATETTTPCTNRPSRSNAVSFNNRRTVFFTTLWWGNRTLDGSISHSKSESTIALKVMITELESPAYSSNKVRRICSDNAKKLSFHWFSAMVTETWSTKWIDYSVHSKD